MEEEKVIEELVEKENEKLVEMPSILDELDDEKPKEVSRAITEWNSKEDLATKMIEIMPMYYDETGSWWVWMNNQMKWIRKDEVDILNFVRFSSGSNVVNSKERQEILQALKQEARLHKPQSIKTTWIQFDKEVVDIETGERFKASPSYFTTNPIPFRLGEKSETPTIDRIFAEWVGEKYVQTLYEVIAYCLLPDYPLHRIFCFMGSGMNGKSCFLNLLKEFIGRDNVCSTELDTLINSRFEVTRLHKKLVCQMGETNFNEMSKTSMLKKLSGGDLIGFEYKNKTPFEDYNYAKIIIATNNLPTTTDKTLGFYRRWVIIDFNNRFSEKVNILSQIPKEEYNNLGLKCIELLNGILKKREFHNEGTIEERMEKYESKSNFLGDFIEKYTEQHENGYITKADFYKKFNSWCKENRHREMSETSLGLAMKKMGVESEKKYFDWLYDGKGGQARCWVGVKWKE